MNDSVTKSKFDINMVVKKVSGFSKKGNRCYDCRKKSCYSGYGDVGKGTASSFRGAGNCNYIRN